MGRIHEEEQQETPTFKHILHDHPLHLTNHIEPPQRWCSGCYLPILLSKNYYNCPKCPFSLHKTCFDMPLKIRHPSDPHHDLLLLLSPSFQCKACSNPGFGFIYKCQKCPKGYHPLCSMRPLQTTHYSHPHALKLQFSPPNYNEIKGFRCDECHTPGFDHWLYRCDDCNFDIHLECATSINPKPSVLDRSRSLPSPSYNNLTRNVGTMRVVPNGGYGPPLILGRSIGPTYRYIGNGNQGGTMNGLGGMLLGGIASGLGQELGKDIIGGLIGDGGGLGDDFGLDISGGFDFF